MMAFANARFATRLAGIGAAVTLAVAVALSLPPLRAVIEQSMAWHMVFQMPLLVLAGWLASRSKLPKFPMRARGAICSLASFNQFGLTGFMAAQIIVAYWMLPSAIDRAVVLPAVDALKLLTLFTAGMLLADAFKRAPAVLQLFFMGYWVSMMAWLGIYFATTDLRLCNAYSLQSQINTGWGLLALGATLSVAWVVSVLKKS